MSLLEKLQEEFDNIEVKFDEINLSVDKNDIVKTCKILRDKFEFDTLIDLCGVDYSAYGKTNWQTKTDNFLRGREESYNKEVETNSDLKISVVYHLLSVKNNYRIRVKTELESDLMIESVIDIWSCANWFEREAFDMFGILFENHPDLRRLLTDYGFIGHPLRKDFPTLGEVEMSYDEELGRVVYKPVSVKMVENVPRVIRN
jgi:NADH-quinone oxidoreductase subunit C